MNKKYYFISGLPRAGNTILSSVLNQNPNITVTGKSFIPEIFYDLKKLQFDDVVYSMCPNEKGITGIYNNVFHNFFSYTNTEYVIDRGEWVTPFNYSILKQYCPNDVKIVLLVRNVLDIIKSFLKICEDNPNFVYNKKYNELDKNTLYQSEIDEKADIIMSKRSYMDCALAGIKWLQDKNLLKDCLIVDYDDLIKDMPDQVNKIYDYLNIPSYSHRYVDLKQLDDHNDKVLGAPIHKIRTDKIERKDNTIKLTRNIINKYGHLNIWKNEN